MMQKLYFRLSGLAVLIAFLVISSCGSKSVAIPKDAEFIDDFQETPKLSSDQIAANQKIIDEYNKRNTLIIETKKQDIIEKAELQAKKDEIVAEQQEFDDLVSKKIKSGEIRELIANAKDADELEKILREKTDLTETEIQELVNKKTDLVKKDKNLRLDALQRIYDRLVRNKDLGINPAFCDASSSLDNFVINPIYYETDVYAIEKSSANNLFDSVEKIVDSLDSFPEMMLQLEGSCDERGSSVYNKNLGDYRWTGAVPLLVSMQFEKGKIRGISKGEECSIKRDANLDNDNWWAKNRRTDFSWILK